MFYEEQSGARKARTPPMTCEWEEVACFGFTCWFHHRCSRWAMDTSHRSNFLKASRLPKILDTLIPAGPQRHSRRVRGHARPILVCIGVLSQLTVKQGHLLTHPLPFHPKRKKNILDNSRLNPGINSHTDYKSHRGKIHKIVSKSKNRSRLRVSTLVTEHAGISILKGKWNKKNIFFELILNERQIQGNHMPILDKWKRKRTLRKSLQSLRVSCPKGKPRGTWSCDCAASLTPGSRGCVGIPHGFGQTK